MHYSRAYWLNNTRSVSQFYIFYGILITQIVIGDTIRIAERSGNIFQSIYKEYIFFDKKTNMLFSIHEQLSVIFSSQ